MTDDRVVYVQTRLISDNPLAENHKHYLLIQNIEDDEIVSKQEGANRCV